MLAFEADRPLFRPGAVLAYVETGDRGLELRGTATGLEARPYSLIKAEPKTFGALQSRLVQVLEGGHEKIVLNPDEWLAIKTWIAMNLLVQSPNSPKVQCC